MARMKCNRWIILLIIELLILLAFLPGCFRQQQPVFTIDGEDVAESITAEDDYYDYHSEYLTLRPGVYRVCVQSDLSEGQRLSVEMTYEEATFQSLRSNVVWILPGEHFTDFEVYVSDEIDSAYLQCCIYGADGTGLVQLEVCETGIGNRLVICIALVAFAVLDGLILFRRRILDGRVSGRQQIVFWGMTAVVLLAYFPFLANCIYLGTESLFHLERIAHLKDTLLQGAAFPIRIQDTWLYDHGYAVSYFCSDLWLLFPALLMVIGFPLMHAYMIYVLAVMVATAWITYTCIRKCVKDAYGALFGSVIYMLSPYYLLNLYNHGAVGEFTAMAFLPLICCGIYQLLTEEVTAEGYGKYKWYLVAGFTGMLHSSVSFTGLVGGFVLVIGVLFLKKAFRRQTLVQMLEAVGIVLLLNAWFGFPMLYMLGSDTYHLHQLAQADPEARGLVLANLLQLLPGKGSMGEGVWQGEPAQLGAGVLLLLLLYLVWRVYRREKDRTGDALVLLLVLALIMSTRYFPWKLLAQLPLIGNVIASRQYPYVWLLVAAALAALLGAFFMKRVMAEQGMVLKALLGAIVAITVVSAVYHVNRIGFETMPTLLYEEENIGTAFVGDGEYLPTESVVAEMGYHEPMAEEGLLWSDYWQEGTDVTLYLENRAGGERIVELPLLGYKGYGIASAQAQDMPYIAEETGAHGDLRIVVPAGYSGRIQVSYEGFRSFRVSEVISLSSAITLLVFYLYHKRKKVQDDR